MTKFVTNIVNYYQQQANQATTKSEIQFQDDLSMSSPPQLSKLATIATHQKMNKMWCRLLAPECLDNCGGGMFGEGRYLWNVVFTVELYLHDYEANIVRVHRR